MPDTQEIAQDFTILIDARLILQAQRSNGLDPCVPHPLKLWVTDAERDDPRQTPETPIYWYWSTIGHLPNSHPVCTLWDAWAQLRLEGRSLEQLKHIDPACELQVTLPRRIAPRPTREFMDWRL